MRRRSWPLPKSHSWRQPSFGSSASLLACLLACLLDCLVGTVTTSDDGSGARDTAGSEDQLQERQGGKIVAFRGCASAGLQYISPAKAGQPAEAPLPSLWALRFAAGCHLQLLHLAFHLASRISLRRSLPVSYPLGSARCEISRPSLTSPNSPAPRHRGRAAPEASSLCLSLAASVQQCMSQRF
jgi:hypothetical protein